MSGAGTGRGAVERALDKARWFDLDALTRLLVAGLGAIDGRLTLDRGEYDW